ncbi:MAG: BspA family leucine-rich repeat surface protein [candidate division SR1 bacterium]|nr:BspA family leucine-rich repeat surface protein [candidate division SR1 bacterium]
MKIYSKLIFSFFLILVSIGLAFAQVSIPSQDFNLGTNVRGLWDQTAQTLTVQGNGKIDGDLWDDVKNTLKLTQDNAKDIKIFFEKDIKFPDRADNFFYQVKASEINFHPNMDTSNVTNMFAMFAEAENFNGNISKWNTSNVTLMTAMFAGATKFNSDISNWNTSNVYDMGQMFSGAIEFNSDISKWDTTNVKSMQGMFSGVTKFNSDISNWSFQKLHPSVRGITINSDGTNTRDFEYPSIYYEKLLKNLEIHFRPLTSLNRKTIAVQSTYCETHKLRDNLIQKGLKITHDKFDCHPKLSISAPTTLSGSAITDTTITFESELSLTNGDLSSLSVDTDNTTVKYSDFNCSLDTDPKKVQCSIKITATKEEQAPKLSIKFFKDIGNNRKIAATASTEYIAIDEVKPGISNLSSNSINHGKTWEISFQTNDEGGAGLWKENEKSDPKYNDRAITYGISSNKTCDNYTNLGKLEPRTTEPFNYTFDFLDSNHNNKYLCIQVKDKVGNTQISSIADPININIPPQLPSQSTTIKETSIIGTTVLTLQGTDQNPGETKSLKYKVIDGNIDDAFSLNRNEIKVNKPLNHENLAQYNLKIQVEDERGLTGEAIMTISIQDDLAPQFEALPSQIISLKRRRSIAPSISFLAKDNGKLTSVNITNLPLGLTATTEKLNDKEIKIIISGAPTLNGIYTTTVIATDNEGITIEKAIKFHVRNINNNQTSQFYDNCPNGDHSGSRTDGRCGAIPAQINTGGNQIILPPSINFSGDQVLLLTGEVKQSLDVESELIEGKTKYQDTAIFNPTVENGKCYTRREYLGIKDSETLVTSEEFKKALSFLRSYEMTMFDSVDSFAPYRNLSREEAAKIFSNFAMHVLCRKPDMNLSVKYSDVENADPSLKPYITLAYQLGVMKGSGMGDGEFRPFDAISKAEVNAVLIRMILKSYLDEKETELKTRYSEYNKVATDLGIINQGAGAEAVPRHDVALMLFRAYKHQVFDRRNIDYFSYVLNSRDLFVR